MTFTTYIRNGMMYCRISFFKSVFSQCIFDYIVSNFKEMSLFFKYWEKGYLKMFHYCYGRFGIQYWSRVTKLSKGLWNPVMLELKDYSPSIVSTGRLTHTSILIPPLFILRILLISGEHSEEMTRIEIHSTL